jgi:hypothetical protein
MKRRATVIGVLVLSLLTLVQTGTTNVLAQAGGPYDLSWSTVDGGGQSSSGGAYWIGGTTGQPDAGEVMVGGSFELLGGFWSLQEGNPTSITLHSLNAASPLNTTGLTVGIAIGLIVCLGGTLLWKKTRRR